jgi:hypothetical protein
MRTSRVVFAGIAVAAAAATTSAFTASNTVADSLAGYGQDTVTGVHATDIRFTQSATDPSLLAAVEFTTTENVSVGHYTATMVLKTAASGTAVGAGSNGVAGVYSCDVSVANKVTCAVTDTPSIATVGTVGLTVHQ